MRHNDAQESLQDGFEVGPLPNMGADGSPQLEPVRAAPPDSPRLCAAGPCRNYHTFQIQLDAQNPIDPGKHGRVYHTEQHHYCYPTAGVETNLGSLPVLSCNRWVPITALFRTKRRIRARFERELGDWRAARDAEQPIEVDLGGSIDLNVEVSMMADRYAEVRLTACSPDATVKMVVCDAIDELVHDHRDDACPIWDRTGPVGTDRNLSDVIVTIDGAPVENLSATVGQLGLTGASQISVQPKETPKSE